MEIIKGAETAKNIRRRIRKKLKDSDGRPVLCLIRTEGDELSQVYEKSLKDCFRKVNMEVRTQTVPSDTDRETYLAFLTQANASNENHGVLTLKPYPDGVTGRDIGEVLSPLKDVDGAGYFLGRGVNSSLPGTAEAVFSILSDLKADLRNKNVAVIGRSDLVGGPVACEAVRLGANVTLLGSHSANLSETLKQADIVISAVGIPGLIRREMLKDGAIILDAGLKRGDDGKMYGDCDRDSLVGLNVRLTPPVGGIGAVTASVIALHTAESFLRCEGEKCEIRIRYLSEKIEKLRYIDGISDWIDLRAAADMELKKGEMKLIPLGVAMKLPAGYEAHVAARSSTYKNFGVIQANAFGIIDESYSGNDDQWFFPALAMRDTVIHVNDRICQFRIERHQPCITFREVSDLGSTNRGGFGATGIQ